MRVGISGSTLQSGLLTVRVGPTMTKNKGGWRLAGNVYTNFVTDASSTVALIAGVTYSVEFKPVPGFITPTNTSVQITAGGNITLPINYTALQPRLNFARGSGVSLSGAVGADFRLEVATNLTASTVWGPVLTVTLPSSPFVFSNVVPTSVSPRFYRAVFVP